jgi:DNA excision repair protein ERCC-4
LIKLSRLSESCTESFALKLYRQANRTGFIKGFSDYPEAFTSGFCKVEKVMKWIFVKKLFLWPRFRDIVEDSLSKHRPDVIELFQPLTTSTKSIQDSILEIMKACLDELKKTNMVDISNITLSDGLFKEFDIIIRGQLDPVWNRLSSETKQLVSDIAFLRKLLQYSTPCHTDVI